MGKAKRATRKELEDVITGIVQELNSLRTVFMNSINYFDSYIEWKGDKIGFSGHLREKFIDSQNETTNTSSVEKMDNNSEKKDRYRKIKQPL
jgi:hypothetical protein